MTDPVDTQAPMRLKTLTRVFYTGNGTVPPGNGLPYVGRIFAVAVTDDLLWYRYGGVGLPEGFDKTWWDPRSGNPIGNGWGNLLHLLGGGDGSVFAVRPDGALLWYQYEGDGTADRSGATGWTASSGNQIGNGWQNLNHLFGGFRDGFDDNGGFGFDVYAAAAADGYLRWYRYEGSGEADPSGRAGWHARSGTVIGKGW